MTESTPDDLVFMDEALALAREAAAADEVPVGAVLVKDGQVIARAANTVEQSKDALAHAEMRVLAEGEKLAGDWRLTECTLYVTKEPCPMCAGAIIHTRLKRVVYGVGDPKAGACGGAINLLQLPGLNHRFECVAGVREAEAKTLLQDFFRAKRQR
ncbi:MAG: tRNA-specific adenosine deaminase [Verrucomicrobia bacterium Tous-C9LFEB]|nr:MAG: tRNA-specific adenosine deaminase [Verrucomicrobia bacterium Tous-C9LFEB]